MAVTRTILSDVVNKRLVLTIFSLHHFQRYYVNISQHCVSSRPPKKPAGAFSKFMNDNPPAMYSKNSDAASSISLCSKIASQSWNDLDPEEKKKLRQSYKEEYEVYQQKYIRFPSVLNHQETAQLAQDEIDKRQKKVQQKYKKELKRYGRPKKPPNSFNLFMKASRLQQGSAAPPEFLKGLVQFWRQMPEEEKHVYQENARHEKEKYQLEIIAWEQKMKDIGRTDLIRKKSQQKLSVSGTSKTDTAAGKKLKSLPQSKPDN